MIAGLPMYLRPENAAAHDRLWQATRDALAADGITAPSALVSDIDIWQLWQAPELFLAQTCGLPYRAHLHDHVTLVGAPDHALPDCKPGEYYSVFVTRADEAPRPFSDYARARLAFNDPMSQSGWAAPQSLARALGFRFANLVQTGAHRASALAVAEGRADIAALDVISWTLMSRWDSFADTLQVIARSAPTPALPFITAASDDAAAIRSALNNALDALDDADRRDLGLHRVVPAQAARYLALPIPAAPCQPEG